MLRNDFLAIRSDSSQSQSKWSRKQDKLFEQALVMYSEESPGRWENIASQVPGKTAMEVWEHYEALVHDVSEIDSGRVRLPSYADDDSLNLDPAETWQASRFGLGGLKSKRADHAERKKGVPWTEEEHRRFLIGLNSYGKGDWRTISRLAVVSRTPTQVASHAQKYFLRLNSLKERKRSSIHDITTIDTQGSTNSSSMAYPVSNIYTSQSMAELMPSSYHH